MKTINDGKSYFYHIIFCMIACAFSLTGCVKEIDRTEDGQTFYFKIEEDLREFDYMKTKGVLSDIFCIDENGIGNVAIYAYDTSSVSFGQNLPTNTVSRPKGVRISERFRCSIPLAIRCATFSAVIILLSSRGVSP